MSNPRLPDHDLTVLVDRASEGATETRAMFGGPHWADMTLARQNEVREQALPYIVAGTRALHELGYHKPRTIGTEEELEALPEGAVLVAEWATYQRVLGDWVGLGGPARTTVELPATVVWEPTA